jgi:hypothetical protein
MIRRIASAALWLGAAVRYRETHRGAAMPFLGRRPGMRGRHSRGVRQRVSAAVAFR